jgi:hypothetical protein
MKRRFYAVFVILGITSGLALAAQPSFAQTSPATGTGTGGGHHNKQSQSKASQNPACQRILDECKKAGFIQGQWKKDNGLWKDCFDPIIKGTGNTTQDGKPIKLPVSQEEIDSCRASKAHHHKQGSTHNGQTNPASAPASK